MGRFLRKRKQNMIIGKYKNAAEVCDYPLSPSNTRVRGRAYLPFSFSLVDTSFPRYVSALPKRCLFIESRAGAEVHLKPLPPADFRCCCLIVLLIVYCQYKYCVGTIYAITGVYRSCERTLYYTV